MSADKSATVSPSSLPQLEWSKSLAEVSIKYCADLLSFSAKRLQAQAEFLQGLVGCSDASDLLKRQSEFVQASWAAYSQELPKALELPKAFGITGKAAG